MSEFKIRRVNMSPAVLESFIWQLPGYFLLKNANSKHLSNRSAAHLHEFNSIDQAIGANDYDIPCEGSQFALQNISEFFLQLQPN